MYWTGLVFSIIVGLAFEVVFGNLPTTWLFICFLIYFYSNILSFMENAACSMLSGEKYNYVKSIFKDCLIFTVFAAVMTFNLVYDFTNLNTVCSTFLIYHAIIDYVDYVLANDRLKFIFNDL